MVLSPTPTAKYLIVTNYKLWGISIAFPNSLLSFSLHPKAHAYLLIKQLQDKKKKQSGGALVVFLLPTICCLGEIRPDFISSDKIIRDAWGH